MFEDNQKVPIDDLPNPGTYQAVKAGCLCPVVDNSYGRGANGGTAKNPDGSTAFWMNSRCPLHPGQNDLTVETIEAPTAAQIEEFWTDK